MSLSRVRRWFRARDMGAWPMPLGQVVDRLGWGYLEPVLCQWRGEENEGAGSQGKEPVGSGSLNTLSTGVGHAGGSRQGPVSEKRRGRGKHFCFHLCSGK